MGDSSGLQTQIQFAKSARLYHLFPVTQPNVFEYKDYREFLRDVYLEHKGRDLSYSFRRLAAELGFKPSNFLHLVVSRKRNLSLKAIKNIQDHLSWSAQSKKYFNFLVQFNQTQNKTEREEAFEELQRILGKRRTTLKPEQYHFFSHWYVPVLKEIVALKGFVSNLNWISKKLKPRVSEDLVRQGLAVLEQLKMVENTCGKWVQSCEHLATENNITSDEICRYHAEVLDVAKKALSYPQEIRDISAMTLGLSRAQYETIKQRVIDFRNEIQQEVQKTLEESEMVAQLNVQLYPVTE